MHRSLDILLLSLLTKLLHLPQPQPISTCGTFHADASVVDVVTDVQNEVVELSSECSTAIDLTMNDDDDDLDVTTEDEGGNPDVKTEDLVEENAHVSDMDLTDGDEHDSAGI